MVGPKSEGNTVLSKLEERVVASLLFIVLAGLAWRVVGGATSSVQPPSRSVGQPSGGASLRESNLLLHLSILLTIQDSIDRDTFDI